MNMKTWKLVAATMLMAVSIPSAAYEAEDFEAEQAIGDSDAALEERKEALRRLEEHKQKIAEARERAKATANEARNLEKHASEVTRSIEQQITAIEQQTALYEKQTASNLAYSKQFKDKMVAARAKAKAAREKRDQAYKVLQSSQAKR